MKKEIDIYKGRYFGVETKLTLTINNYEKACAPDLCSNLYPDFYKIGILTERIHTLMLLGDRDLVDPFGIGIKKPLVYLYTLEEALGYIDPAINTALNACNNTFEADFDGVKRNLFLNGLLRILSECDDVELRANALHIANARRGVYYTALDDYIL